MSKIYQTTCYSCIYATRSYLWQQEIKFCNSLTCNSFDIHNQVQNAKARQAYTIGNDTIKFV